MGAAGDRFLGWAAGAESLVLFGWEGPPGAQHSVLSPYVERFWLPVLGPTSVLLARNVARRFDALDSRVPVRAAELAFELGLGVSSARSSPLLRSFARLVDFGVACDTGDCVGVALAFPPLTQRMRSRLPAPLAAELVAFEAAAVPARPRRDSAPAG